MPTLSDHAQNVWRAISAYYAERGLSPTVRELRDLTGIRATVTLNDCLNELERTRRIVFSHSATGRRLARTGIPINVED